MNKTGISWCDYTFNPLVGCTNNCSHEGKPYCYAREVAKRSKCSLCRAFMAHSHFERLDDYPKKDAGRIVFLGSMAGIWEPGAFCDADIQRVLDFVAAHPGDTFLTLTKNPKQYQTFSLPGNLWAGTTITRNDPQLFYWASSVRAKRFISFEPLLEDVSEIPMFVSEWQQYSCIIIGPLNHRGQTPTKAEWILNLMNVAEDAGVMVHLKPQCRLAGIPDDVIQAHQMTPWTREG